MAALLSGQLGGLLALLMVGGVLVPMLFAFLAAGAGCFVAAEPRRA